MTKTDRTAEAARRAAMLEQMDRDTPEPSLGARLGQIGILGWAIVTPVLLGVLIGRWLDPLLDTNVMFSAALIFLGAIIGMHAAWKWMHRP